MTKVLILFPCFYALLKIEFGLAMLTIGRMFTEHYSNEMWYKFMLDSANIRQEYIKMYI